MDSCRRWFLGARTDLDAVRADVEKESIDIGVAHSAEGVAVVEYLEDVVVVGLTGFVVDNVDCLGGVNDAVGPDDLSLPGNVTFGLGRMVGTEKTHHFGLLHHNVEGVAEGIDSVRVEMVAGGVGVEGGVGVVDGVDEGEDFVDLIATADGSLVELAEEGGRLVGYGDT